MIYSKWVNCVWVCQLYLTKAIKNQFAKINFANLIHVSMRKQVHMVQVRSTESTVFSPQMRTF